MTNYTTSELSVIGKGYLLQAFLLLNRHILHTGGIYFWYVGKIRLFSGDSLGGTINHDVGALFVLVGEARAEYRVAISTTPGERYYAFYMHPVNH